MIVGSMWNKCDCDTIKIQLPLLFPRMPLNLIQWESFFTPTYFLLPSKPSGLFVFGFLGGFFASF